MRFRAALLDSDLLVLDTVDFLNSGFGCFTATGVEDRASLRVNLRGNTPPKLIEQCGRLLLSYTHPFTSGASFSSRIDYIYRGEYQYRVFNHPMVDTVPSYNITSLRLHV